MKKILLLMISILLVTACTSKIDLSKYEKTMKEYGTTYYNDYIKGRVTPSPDRFDVSIGKLREANEKVEAKFDLNKVSRCNSESKITLILDDDGKITDYEYSFECE